MAEDEFVDDGEIKWTGQSGIAGTVVGTGITLAGVTIAEFVGLITVGITSGLSSLFGWFGSLV